MKEFCILLFIMLVSCNSSKIYTIQDYNESKYQEVLLDKLIESPELYEGNKIELIGKFHFTIETSSISKGGSMYGGIWIDFINNKKLVDENGNDLKKLGNRGDLSGHKIKIRGEFTSKKRGHLASYKGSLKDIVYFEVIN